MAEQINDDSCYTAVKLPKNVRPIHYDLWFKPDLNQFTFQGRVKIEYVAEEENISSIVLNTNELEIFDGSIGENNKLIKVTYSRKSETATLEFSDKIDEKGSLNLSFIGKLNDKLRGFYRSAFKIKNSVVYGAITQFAPTDARLCFPCWDEPAIKATFTVSLTAPRWAEVGGKKIELVALSNMPEALKSKSEDEVSVTFEKSPIMSTYLLAIVVGPFKSIEGNDDKRPIRVYAAPGKEIHGQVALEVAVKSLKFYEEYFCIDYPLPKMDLVAVPDFAYSAMENWGLITYRETTLLVDPVNTSVASRQYVAIVVAHELAHQWFGNLVTMQWWTHLWLNEGFASFMQYLCVDHIFPHWDLWSQFLNSMYCQALELDALESSHPIEVPINNPSEIPEIFDNISYKKGASVIRMLFNYIGKLNFRNGMKDYLNKFAYSNASTEDLWDALERASKKPVRKLMSSWTSQKGFPWLLIEHRMLGNDCQLTLSQDKFSANGDLSNENPIWVIPINVVTGSSKSNEAMELCLFEGKTCTVTVPEVGSSWLKLNSDSVGLYRTLYPAELGERLRVALEQQSLNARDRLNILRDAHALCQAGKFPTDRLLKLVSSLKDETNFIVWESIDSTIGHLDLLTSFTSYHCSFQAFARGVYHNIYNRVGWFSKETDDHTTAMLRALVISRLVSLGQREVISEAQSLFADQVDGEKMIDANLRLACYKAISKFGDESSYTQLLQICKASDIHEEKNRVLAALAYTNSDKLLKKSIDLALSDEIRIQDKLIFFKSLGAANPNFGFDLLKTNKDLIREVYQNNTMISRIIKSLTENFATDDKAQQVSDFFKDNIFPGAERAAEQAIEVIRSNSKWLKRDSKQMEEFLISQ